MPAGPIGLADLFRLVARRAEVPQPVQDPVQQLKVAFDLHRRRR